MFFYFMNLRSDSLQLFSLKHGSQTNPEFFQRESSFIFSDLDLDFLDFFSTWIMRLNISVLVVHVIKQLCLHQASDPFQLLDVSL